MDEAETPVSSERHILCVFLCLCLFHFSVRFHIIIEKISASLSYGKRKQEKGVTTGGHSSARRLKGGMLCVLGLW